MEDRRILEELVKRLRDRVSSFSIAIVDLEALLEIEKQKNTELENEIAELKSLDQKNTGS